MEVGRKKNITLIEKIKDQTKNNLVIQQIDDYGIDGDFIESQAFAYLAIRSFFKTADFISFNNRVQTTCYRRNNC